MNVIFKSWNKVCALFLVIFSLIGCMQSALKSTSEHEHIQAANKTSDINQSSRYEYELGERGNWLRGSWGVNWKPVNVYNGRSENLSIEPFLEQIKHLQTIDYIQVHLGESSIKSPVHIAPHPLLEKFWQGDTNSSGEPINLIVPRESTGIDPFLNILRAIKTAGMKTQVYVNSSNMLERDGNTNPSYIPNITARWKQFCDTDPEVQTFINSQPYHTHPDYPNRQYMFAYAEFILKAYSERYGELIDGWLFDSGRYIYGNGDNATSGVEQEQTLYRAFAKAAQAGNPSAPVSFNNSPERDTEQINPFSEATHYDDYMFGHPYNGGKIIGDHKLGLYSRNFSHIEKMKETNGNVHSGTDPHDWTWDDKVIGHLDPPMSTSSWNGGNTPALTDDEFLLWNLEATKAGGAISWGVSLVSKSTTNNDLLVAKGWALRQLTLMDEHLAKFQQPNIPNWARADTILTKATRSFPYKHILIEDKDFWHPKGRELVLSIAPEKSPLWLTILENPEKPGQWILSGTPNEIGSIKYNITLIIDDGVNHIERVVTLDVE